MSNIKIVSLFNIPITKFPFIAYIPTLPWAIPFPIPCFKFILLMQTQIRGGGGGSPRSGTGEGEASGGACVGCGGALSEWCHGGGQWMREIAGRQRDDHGPTLEWARLVVEATVTAGDVSGGWAGGVGVAR
jgi:hypothetical protein